MIERLRLGQYAWRTEQTYREWAWRLAQFVGARGLESATDEDIKGFLSELAVRGRASIATQKQAFNARRKNANIERPTLNAEPRTKRNGAGHEC